MSKDLNKWIGIGRIGKDIELRHMPDGKAVANFSIACGDDYKDKDGNKVERTEWINISAFGRLAEIIGEYCGKGSQIYIEGKYTTKKYQDSQTGTDRYSTTIVASEIQMLGGKPGSSQGQPQQSTHQEAPQKGGYNPNDGGFDGFDYIPF